MAGMMHASHINIDEFYQIDGAVVEFFHLVMPKNSFSFYFNLYDLIM